VPCCASLFQSSSQSCRVAPAYSSRARSRVYRVPPAYAVSRHPLPVERTAVPCCASHFQSSSQPCRVAPVFSSRARSHAVLRQPFPVQLLPVELAAVPRPVEILPPSANEFTALQQQAPFTACCHLASLPAGPCQSATHVHPSSKPCRDRTPSHQPTATENAAVPCTSSDVNHSIARPFYHLPIFHLSSFLTHLTFSVTLVIAYACIYLLSYPIYILLLWNFFLFNKLSQNT
jgi:hypothetical protein